MRFLFLNQYFPPEPAPTGLLLRELADFLVARGHEVAFISSRQSYRGAKKNRHRRVREVRALLSILVRGFVAARPDVVLSATSPPLLLLVAMLVAMRHRAKSVHWLFDMYPELAVALGEIRSGALPRMVESLMRWSYRRTDTVVALDDDMLVRLKRYGATGEKVLPWIVAPKLANPALNSRQSEMKTWLYSGNLGRAHEWETLLQTQLLLEKRGLPWRLVFQGGGPSWKPAQARATELALKNCEWKPYVDEEELRASLLAAEVLIVTQKPETQGLLWPSKLAFVRTLPRRILWVGPTGGAIASELRLLPQAGIFSPGSAAQIADWLEAASATGPPVVDDPSAVRDVALQKWLAILGFGGN